MGALDAFRFGTGRWDPTHRFETSWLLSPWALFACRALISLYAFTTLIFVLAWQCAHGPLGCTGSQNSFSYFTTLTYWGLAFYFLVAAVHTATYARAGTPWLDRFPRPLQALHAAFYTTIIVFPFIVTIVYWARLYEGTWYPDVYSGWSNVSQHLLNSAFALFEIVVPRTEPPPPVHILWLLVVLALYLAVAYITHATKGFYTYDFLDPKAQGALLAAYVCGIAVGCLVLYGFAWGLVWLRRWATETKLGMMGKFSQGDLEAVEREDVTGKVESPATA
ncbi:hypothetical protein VTJ83DRAFT_2244 [Remersonia thermophila]|uniref:FAR-17a/AIG1-like protein n=1 Tax=Remersonia thermophila TaxID=72144 RepID=A0ABR4DIT2_9PEZI